MRFAASWALFACMRCVAQSVDDDSAALAFADRVGAIDSRVFDWRGSVEAAGVQAAQNYGLPSATGERLSVDARYQGALAPSLRGVVSDRLDIDWASSLTPSEINTLREAYVSWRDDATLLDIGRVNVRSGVAFGYNPTDFLRSDAVRQVDSLDPDSLRANRLGTVMVRGQLLWDSGSATVVEAPRLSNAPSNGPFSLDLGATNHQNRWSVSVSQRLASNLTPQWLVYSAGGGAVAGGLNVTALVNPAMIVYAEWSGGRGPTLLSASSGSDADQVFGSRLSTGLTYTTPFRLSVTLEYETNSASLDARQWSQLQHGSAATFQRYLEFAADQQDLPTRRAFFSYWQMSDLGWRHLDAGAFSRLDLADRSRIDWIEARYHWSRADLALQVQHDSGSQRTAFGASAQRRVVQLLLDFYFP